MARDHLTAPDMEAGIDSWREPGSGPPGAPRADENALVTLFRLFRANARVILLSGLAVGSLAFALSLMMPKRYASTASLLFQQSPLVGQLTGFNQGNQFNTVAEEGATNVALVGSRPVAAETAAQLGSGFTEKSVAEATALEARANTRIVDVTAEAATPQEAERIANTYVRVFLTARRREVQRTIQQALTGLEHELDGLSPEARNGTAGKELTQRIGTLRILSAVQSPNVELIQPAQLPDLPASPRPKRNALLGLLFGLLVGIGLAAVRQQVDERLRNLDDVESLARRPILGTVPRHPALARGTQPADLPPDVVDAFRLAEFGLRAQIGTHPMPYILVTSAAVGEGKTVCAWHLAVTMGAAQKRVLYIEADLRQPTAAKRWSLDPRHGLADVLVGSVSRAEAVQRISVPREGRAPAILDALTAGEATRSPWELFDSRAMRELLDECVVEYDAIVLDGPALPNLVEAVPLVNAVSGVVIVAAPGATLRQGFERLQDGLEQMGANVYGILANGVRRPSLLERANPIR